ncbi:hypothetical protein [Brevibacillus porteri]|nr:hypothetical protein [Brevibacillus porteri]MED1802043.1 hypothetical protein [Brevibacillus porteri]MED2747881.1 hypothetical protein [Brevibacillus porteri]MED2813139.1 hypothetical protein [Brevibacillus porteri]MED2892496.1 hypothetical protein [Brevibacillus porteri]MED4898218.1 hypothetical protein [Brevibacillus porteri]
MSTFELDVKITEDKQAVITHDRKISGNKCRGHRPTFRWRS